MCPANELAKELTALFNFLSAISLKTFFYPDRWRVYDISKCGLQSVDQLNIRALHFLDMIISVNRS